MQFGTQLTIYISFPRRKSWELILSAIKRQNINWVLSLHGHVDVRSKDSRGEKMIALRPTQMYSFKNMNSIEENTVSV